MFGQGYCNVNCDNNRERDDATEKISWQYELIHTNKFNDDKTLSKYKYNVKNDIVKYYV